MLATPTRHLSTSSERATALRVRFRENGLEPPQGFVKRVSGPGCVRTGWITKPPEVDPSYLDVEAGRPRLSTITQFDWKSGLRPQEPCAITLGKSVACRIFF